MKFLFLTLLLICIVQALLLRRFLHWLNTWQRLCENSNEANKKLMAETLELATMLAEAQTERDLYKKACEGSENCRKKLVAEKRSLMAELPLSPIQN